MFEVSVAFLICAKASCLAGSGVREGTCFRGTGSGRRNSLFWAPFAGYKDSNPFDHLGRRRGALRQENIRVKGAIEGVDGAGNDHCRQTRMDLFGAAHQFVAVHLRHQEIAQDEIERAGNRPLKDFQCFLCRICCNDTVATGFEKEGADGEDLFIVIYAEDRLLRAHAVSLLPEATLWWLAADGPVWRACWFAGEPVWWFEIPRGPAAYGHSARDGPSAPGEWKTKERGSPVCSTRDQFHLSDKRGCRTAGCERGPMPWQVATRLQKAEFVLLRLQKGN